MNPFFAALAGAVDLITHADQKLVDIISLSLKVSATAVVIASVLGLAIGAIVSVTRLPDGAW